MEWVWVLGLASVVLILFALHPKARDLKASQVTLILAGLIGLGIAIFRPDEVSVGDWHLRRKPPLPVAEVEVAAPPTGSSNTPHSTPTPPGKADASASTNSSPAPQSTLRPSKIAIPDPTPPPRQSEAAKNSAAAPLSVQTDPPRPSVIINADWLVRPTVEQLYRYFPDKAAADGVSGRAQLSCVVNRRGQAHDCSVVSEEPEGYGYGAAALAMSREFRLKPMTKDGVPLDGGTIRIPLRFTAPPVDPPAQPATPAP